jgi:hypothetical protein
MNLEELTLDIEQHIVVRAPMAEVFDGVVKQLSERSATPDGTPLPLVLELRPGGRWFRDLGDGTGHLWGHVQVVKPPRLLELSGPLFMSYPVANHVQVRLEEEGDVTRVTLRHQALGRIDPNHREGVSHGWKNYLEQIKSHCE